MTILNAVNFFSESLGINTSMNVILPQRSLIDAQTRRKPKYRCLYLLHGYSDDHTAWQRFSSIERYVDGLNLAVIMPSVNLSFYTDMEHGGKYWQFISEEVPAVVQELFPLSLKRADNFVAGLSMGGYGAFKLALSHPERFAAAASLSGSMDIRETVKEHGDPDEESWLAEMHNIFGDLRKVPGSQHDLYKLAKKAAKGTLKPRLYLCCGTEDPDYEINLLFRDHLSSLDFNLTFEDGPGEHNWAYWDRMIQHVLDWLPG
jgi:putative tributyrin esterase